MNNYIFYPHSGSGNHGCEAIIRSTVDLFARDIVVFTNNIEEDNKYMPTCPCTFACATAEIKRFRIRHLTSLVRKYLLREKEAFDRETFRPLLSSCNKNSIFFSVGGDIYCYERPDFIYRTNKYIRDKRCKTVLWGCSVEETSIDDEMKEDLQGYDLICARESITYGTLKAINSNTILTVDPAFTLKMEKVDLPSKHYIGINLSPMVIERETIPGITIKNYCYLIDHILQNTDFDIALIPHVVWKSTDDREVLTRLYNIYRNNPRIIMVDDHSCTEQKYIISNCEVFIGARTHATIAAYSTCVPTLVVGYSVKARGIAKDLFNDIDHYVLPVQKLNKPEDLKNAFEWIYERKYNIRNHLETIMPAYKEKINLAVQKVYELEE